MLNMQVLKLINYLLLLLLLLLTLLRKPETQVL